jgi:hypothetical protein
MGAKQGSKMERVLKKDDNLNIRAAHDQTVKFEEDEEEYKHSSEGQIEEENRKGFIREPEPEEMPGQRYQSAQP